MFSCFTGAGAGDDRLPTTVQDTQPKRCVLGKLGDCVSGRKPRSDERPMRPAIRTSTASTSTDTLLQENPGVLQEIPIVLQNSQVVNPSLGAGGSSSKKFFGVSINAEHGGLLFNITTMIVFALLSALGDPVPYKEDMSFKVACYSLLPAVIWLILLATSFLFSLIPVWKTGSNSKRDLAIPMVLAFGYGLASIGVKASAFKVSLWGTEKLFGYWFLVIYCGIVSVFGVLFVYCLCTWF